MRRFLLIACLALSAAGCGEPQFLAVGSRGFTCRSTDGIEWTQGRFGFADLRSIAYGSGMYMAATRDRIYSSRDGIRWSMEVFDSEHEFAGIASSGDSFVALTTKGPEWYYDALTAWHPVSYEIGDALAPRISYAAGRFMIATNKGIHFNTEPGSLNDWQFVRVLPGTQQLNDLSAVAGGDTTLVVADIQGHAYYAPADNFAATSSWTRVDLDLPPYQLTTVTYGNYQGAATFILSSSGMLKKSIDEGRTWQDVTPENFADVEPTAGAFHDGQFLLCSPDSGIWRSADGGATWEKIFSSGLLSKPFAIAASTE